MLAERGLIAIIKIIDECKDSLTYIALLFSSLIVHGAVSDSFLRSSNGPILKGKHGVLTLSPIYGKLFGKIVLYRYGDHLFAPEPQFGFQP